MLEVHSGVCKDMDVGHRGKEGDGKKRKSISNTVCKIDQECLTVHDVIRRKFAVT